MPYGTLGPNWELLNKEDKGKCAILVTLNAGGHKYYFGTLDMVVQEFETGNHLHFNGCIMNNPTYSETVDPFNKSFATSQFTIEVMDEFFPVKELRQSGMLLQDIDAEVVWFIDNDILVLEQFQRLMIGKLSKVLFHEQSGKVSFTIRQLRMRKDKPIPGVLATTDTLSSLLHSDDRGKAYPIIIGDAKRVPVLDLTTEGAGNTYYLVMHDVEAEFVSGDTPVSAVYNGDETATLNAQSPQTDAENNRYWRIDADDGAGGFLGREVNVDVVGHQPTTLIEVVRFLVTNFSNNTDAYDIASLLKYARDFSTIEISAIFNQRESGNIFELISQRLVKQLPFMVMERADKIYFRSLFWDREVVMKLKFGRNLIRMTSPVRETDIDQIRNSFTITYQRSGYRDERRGAILKNADNDFYCLDSKHRYGERALEEFSAGDVANEEGALKILNWYVETYTRMRVMVSYEVNLEAAHIRLWDTVRVYDEYQDWDHGPYFKVVGIKYSTGATIGLDLMSIDDIANVYDVNRRDADVSLPFIPPPSPIGPDDNMWFMGELVNATYRQNDSSMRLLAADASDYDVGANDFTLVYRFAPCNIKNDTTIKAIFAKWETTTDDRCMMLYYYSNELRFAISKDGTFNVGSYTLLSWVNPFYHGVKLQITVRYQENGDGTSTLKLRIYNLDADTLITELSTATAVSPVFISSVANVEINAADNHDTTRLGSQYLYYWGFWNGHYLPDDEVSDLEDGTIEPTGTTVGYTDYYQCDDIPADAGGDISTTNGNTFTFYGNALPISNQDPERLDDWWYHNSNRMEGKANTDAYDPSWAGTTGDHYTWVMAIKLRSGSTYASYEGLIIHDRTRNLFNWQIAPNSYAPHPDGMLYRHISPTGNHDVWIDNARSAMFNQIVVAAVTLQKVGTGTSILNMYIVHSGGTAVATPVTNVDPRPGTGAVDYIDLGQNWGGNYLIGNIYWWGYRIGKYASQTEIENIYDETSHMMKLHPNIFDDNRIAAADSWQPFIRYDEVNTRFTSRGGGYPTKDG